MCNSNNFFFNVFYNHINEYNTCQISILILMHEPNEMASVTFMFSKKYVKEKCDEYLFYSFHYLYLSYISGKSDLHEINHISVEI